MRESSEKGKEKEKRNKKQKTKYATVCLPDFFLSFLSAECLQHFRWIMQIPHAHFNEWISGNIDTCTTVQWFVLNLLYLSGGNV